MAAATLVAATAADASWLVDLVSPDVSRVRAAEIDGEDFAANLARRYRMLALFEADRMLDLPAAVHFAGKALAASRGAAVAPDYPWHWDLPQHALPAIEIAYEHLSSALASGAQDAQPELAAEAQTQFDCWLEQETEGRADPWQPRDIAACRAGFAAAIAALRARHETHPVLLAHASPPAFVRQARSYRPTSERATIHFDFDQATIGPEARQILAAFIASLGDPTELVVTVTGHTDTAGSAEHNLTLSRRRAEAVRDELLRRGLAVRALNKVNVRAKGETDPAVATADGVPSRLNRRVEIAVYRLQGTPEGSPLLSDETAGIGEMSDARAHQALQ